MYFQLLLKVKLSYDPIGLSVGRSVIFLKGREVSLPCSYRSSLFSPLFVVTLYVIVGNPITPPFASPNLYPHPANNVGVVVYYES